ncbi:MAG: rod shape-determining protein [Desulfovibrio sp.]|nr:MAG: rod shape-determining protein [Desulfovibrio sp.]
MLGKLLSPLGRDLAMDLGTANTLIALKDGSVAFSEPTLAAVSRKSGKVAAVGQEARDLLHNESGFVLVRPLRQGVIADFDVTQSMISRFISQAMGKPLLAKPNMVIAVPGGVTQVEMKAVIEAANQAGAGDVRLIAEPMAAAMGMELSIHEPMGRMVLDIGGGTTECAVITMAAMASATSVRIAGDEMNAAIEAHLREAHGLNIDEDAAEQAKLAAGSALPLNTELHAEILGRDLKDGSRRTVSLSNEEIHLALEEPLEAIVGAVNNTFREAAPELARDVATQGIHLAGGGALLRGMAEFLEQQTKLPVIMDHDPLTTIVRGASQVLADRKGFSPIFLN